MRNDQRQYYELRAIRFIPNFTKHAEGSVLVEFGETRVLCTASVEENVPPFLRGKHQGWVTAEYGMLPRSTHSRMKREAASGKQSGRTQEIQRLIGRSLRAVVDLEALGERQIVIDCDVIQADGGTRTASICGAFLALSIAIKRLILQGKLSKNPIKEALAAISIGIVNQHVMLDLNYQEDSQCDTDMNVVMTESGRIVELQGTAEQEPFDRAMLNQMIDIAAQGISQLIELQKKVLRELEN